MIGVIECHTANVGDDIQTLAALQYAPSAEFVRRDTIGLETRDLKIIGNAWWQETDCYPTTKNILPISMHIAPRTQDRMFPWLKSLNQPIGCRDLYTQAKLTQAGIETYFSGCLTLTFPENKTRRDGGIVYTDYIPDEWIPAGATFSEHINYEYEKLSLQQHLDIAQDRLELYRNAELVITGRLHALLPCIAMGTPVVFCRDVWSPERLSGYEPYLHDFKGWNPKDYPVNRPTKLIDLLKRKVEKYVTC